MNFTCRGASMPYSVRRRSRPTQKSGESILAATLSLMNATSCGASMLHSVRKRSRPAQNSGELILVPTPWRERSVLRCSWLKPNLEKKSWVVLSVPSLTCDSHTASGPGDGTLCMARSAPMRPAAAGLLNAAARLSDIDSIALAAIWVRFDAFSLIWPAETLNTTCSAASNLRPCCVSIEQRRRTATNERMANTNQKCRKRLEVKGRQAKMLQTYTWNKTIPCAKIAWAYDHIIILSYYHTIILSYYHNIILSYYHIIILLYYHVLMLSFNHDITLPYCHITL